MNTQEQNSQPEKRGRGRPPTGAGIPVQVKMQPSLLADLDLWVSLQDDAPTRPEAIRRLITDALDMHAAAMSATQ